MYVKACIIILCVSVLGVYCGPEENEGVIYANPCEACKILAIELQERLTTTGKSHDVIETGYAVDDVKPKKRTQYKRSELRLLDSLEDVCDEMLKYQIHKERKDSTRFAKGMSQTFQALHGLVNKGVKVELGIPIELWDKPPAEVTNLKTQCEGMVEKYEEVIENWYFHKQDEAPLIKYLCEDQILQGQNAKCLNEVLRPKGEKGDPKEEL